MFLRVFRFVWGLYVGAVNGFGVLWIQSAQGLCFGKVGTLVPLESEIGFISLKVSGCTAFMLQALIFMIFTAGGFCHPVRECAVSVRDSPLCKLSVRTVFSCPNGLLP